MSKATLSPSPTHSNCKPVSKTSRKPAGNLLTLGPTHSRGWGPARSATSIRSDVGWGDPSKARGEGLRQTLPTAPTWQFT